MYFNNCAFQLYNLGEVYRICADAATVDDLIEGLQGPLKDGMDIDAITLALVKKATVVVASALPLTTEFIERAQAHGARCVEVPAEDIAIRQVCILDKRNFSIGENTHMLWTSAIESAGRLAAVVTFYRTKSHKASPSEVAALRQIRALIADTFGRLTS